MKRLLTVLVCAVAMITVPSVASASETPSAYHADKTTKKAVVAKVDGGIYLEIQSVEHYALPFVAVYEPTPEFLGDVALTNVRLTIVPQAYNGDKVRPPNSKVYC
jgi:hypothetical protein